MRSCIRVPWDDIHDVAEAYRLLALFRASNPLLGHLQPDDLYWEVSWTGGFTPVDLDQPAEDRAAARTAVVSDVVLSCSNAPDAVGPTLRLPVVPAVVKLHLLSAERRRTR